MNARSRSMSDNSGKMSSLEGPSEWIALGSKEIVPERMVCGLYSPVAHGLMSPGSSCSLEHPELSEASASLIQ